MARNADELYIAAPVDVVFDVVADERNEPAYNPAMVRTEKLSYGPIGVGTRFRGTVVSRGRAMHMIIEYTGYDRPHRIESLTRMPTADIGYELTFRAEGPGTVLRWSWQLRPHGRWRLLAPLIGVLGRRQERRIWAGLKGYLERRPREGQPV